MKSNFFGLVACALTTTQAAAQSASERLCGADHINEAQITGPVLENPDGYYLAGLQTQLSHGDPRIVQATGSTFYVCTRPVTTPGMTETEVILTRGQREVSRLFVPVRECPTGQNS